MDGRAEGGRTIGRAGSDRKRSEAEQASKQLSRAHTYNEQEAQTHDRAQGLHSRYVLRVAHPRLANQTNARTISLHSQSLSRSLTPALALDSNRIEPSGRTGGRGLGHEHTDKWTGERTNERTNKRSETQTQTHLHERRDAEQHVAPRRLDPREVALGRRHGGREGRLEDAHDEARDDLWRRARGDVGGVGGERGDSDA